MYHFKNVEDFIEHYGVFLHIKALLYQHETADLVSATDYYRDFVLDLMDYVHSMNDIERAKINQVYAMYGDVQDIEGQLMDQLEMMRFEKDGPNYE